MLYPEAQGVDLTAEQVTALDDTFFQSDPGAYFRSRIDTLLREPAPVDYREGLAARVLGLGLAPAMLTMTAPSSADRELQVALDAFALRHHVAECLCRLIWAVVAARRAPGSSVWVTLTDGPRSGVEVVNALRDMDTHPIPAGELFLTTAQQVAAGAGRLEGVEEALCVAWAWVMRAADLLTSDRLDTNAGNNKLKHGFAVRARNDLTIWATTTPPNDDGTISVSALNAGVGLIDAISAEFLERLTKRHGRAGALEVTALNLRPDELVAETVMMTAVHAAAFASAADRHLRGRDLTRPPHRGLPLGPLPPALVRRPVGIRQGLTYSVDGTRPRDTTVEHPAGVSTLVQTGDAQRGVVVADDALTPDM